MSRQKNKAPYWRKVSPDGYLINHSDGSTEWYHVTPTGCSFEPDHLTYLSADKQYLLGEMDAILNDEERELGQAHICTVRIRGLKWSDVFDIADYLELGGGEYSTRNACGKALEQKYDCYIPDTYHYIDFECLGSCNPIKMGFKAWLEDEGDFWPENPSGYWPETLVVATGDGVEIEVVGEDLLEMVEDDWRVVERSNPQNLPIYVNNLGVHTNAPIPLYHTTIAADAIIEEGFKTPDELPLGSFGLGSSGMGLISMTGDHQYAESICVHMATHARIGIGDLRWSELMADFRRVSPKRYKAIVDGTDRKPMNLIRVLKMMDKGQVPVNRGMFGEDMSLSLDPERYELVSMEEYVEYQRDYCESKNFKHMIDTWTNPAKRTLAELYNELLWINDGTIENPVGDSDLWTRFLGKDLSILDKIACVRADLKPGMRIVSRNSSVEMPSVFYGRSGNFSVDEYGVQKLKRGEDLYTRVSRVGYRAPIPLPTSETRLTFDVDSEFVDRVPTEDYNKFAVYLFAEDEFRLPAPRDQLTPAVLYCTAMDILEMLPDLWQGKDVTCFYPKIGDQLKTLRDNLWS